MRKILVLGGTGLTGRRLVQALIQEGHSVRCSVRNLEAARGKLPAACELVRGDIADAGSMEEAIHSVEAVYNCVHTLSPQPNAAGGRSFVETELEGLANVLSACRKHGVRRILYLTFLNVSPDASTSWSRGRWKAERLLLDSGLDATVLRPGQIVGKGGYGFDTMMERASSRLALVLGSGKARRRNIALDDLVHYLVRALDEPRTFGKAFDVGCDDVLTGDEMIDVAADVLGRSPPWKIHVPRSVMMALAPLVESMAKLPSGAFRDLVIGMDEDMVGDPGPLRAILPHAPLGYREAIERALCGDGGAAEAPRR